MEYTVILTRPSSSLPWRAVAPGLPDCAVEAPTRAEAIKGIRQRIMAVASYSEVLRLELPTPKTADDLSQGRDETPWQWFGAFKNDPTWGPLFDEVERQRDAHLIGD